MNFVCISNYENIIGTALLNEFLQLPGTEVVIIKSPLCGTIDEANLSKVTAVSEDDFLKDIMKEKLKDNNTFIFNPRFVNELDEVSLAYSDKVCIELNNLFRMIKRICNNLIKDNKTGRLLFVTTNPSVSHISLFPISPIYDEAVHSLIRSLAKELKPFNIVFNGICIEPVSESLSDDERKNYRKKAKIYAVKKSPIKLGELVSFIKHLSLADYLSLTSGNIFYIAEGLDQMNF